MAEDFSSSDYPLQVGDDTTGTSSGWQQDVVIDQQSGSQLIRTVDTSAGYVTPMEINTDDQGPDLSALNADQLRLYNEIMAGLSGSAGGGGGTAATPTDASQTQAAPRTQAVPQLPASPGDSQAGTPQATTGPTTGPLVSIANYLARWGQITQPDYQKNNAILPPGS